MSGIFRPKPELVTKGKELVYGPSLLPGKITVKILLSGT